MSTCKQQRTTDRSYHQFNVAYVLAHIGLLCVFVLLRLQSVSALVYLSDLSTPSLIIDVHAFQRSLGSAVPVPSIAMTESRCKLMPVINPKYGVIPRTFDGQANAIDFRRLPENQCYCYIHSKVIRSREQKRVTDADTFLVELDVPENTWAHLVLGLNNHHTISYYWGRSAGMGASMEAPGVKLHGSCLLWESATGFADCNSNDGKRSEWVNFLRSGDQVQLKAENDEAAILLFQHSIYGVSAKNRPLGSEPIVVCDWKLEEL